jgi:mannose-1-phosphate guanylyltransferase
VVNGDLLSRHDLTSQLTFGLGSPGSDAVLHIRTVPDARPFGCVVADAQGRVSAFVEKSPTPPSSEVNAGTYVLTRAVVESLPHGIASLERDVLPALVAQGRVLAYREDALWEDIGTPAALVRGSRALVLRSGRDAHIDPTAHVAPGAYVSHGSAVGPGAIVEAGARVLGSVVMSGALVEAGACVVDSALAPGEKVRRGHILEGVPRRQSQQS